MELFGVKVQLALPLPTSPIEPGLGPVPLLSWWTEHFAEDWLVEYLAGYCLLVSVRLLFHTKKLKVSQELNISQTAMPLSLHDFVVSVMSGNASVTTFYKRAKSLLIVIVKMLHHLIYCHIHACSLFSILMTIFSCNDVHNNIQGHNYWLSGVPQHTPCLKKNCRCLIFYNVKTIELILIIFATLHHHSPEACITFHLASHSLSPF